MKEMLKAIGFYKLKQHIDIFVFAGKIKRDNLLIEKMEIYFILPIMLISILLSSVGANKDSFLLVTGGLALVLYCLFVTAGLNKRIIKKISKIYKKEFKKKVDKDFNIKDKELIAFVDEYFKEIRELKLSKKETIKFVNDWENSKKLLNEKRITLKIEEVEKKKEEIKKLSKEIENLTN